MSDETDRLATLISDLRVGHRSEQLADAILASDWLAERDARIRRQALNEAVEAIRNVRGRGGLFDRGCACVSCESARSCLTAVAKLRDGGGQ